MSLCYELLWHTQTVANHTVQADPNLLSTCIQYDASLKAAEKQTKAGDWAAVATLVAGLFALVAGGLAYMSSTKPVREDRRQRKMRTDSLRIFIDEYLNDRIKLLTLFAQELCNGDLEEVKKTIFVLKWSFNPLMSQTFVPIMAPAFIELSPKILRAILQADRGISMIAKMSDEISASSTYKSEEMIQDAKSVMQIVSNFREVRQDLENTYPNKYVDNTSSL